MAIASPQVAALLPGGSNDAIDWTISAPGTFVGFWADGLAGTDLLQVQVKFYWGTGSGGVRVCLQSSMDEGNTAYDVAIMDFAAAAKTVQFAIRPVFSSAVQFGVSDLIGPGEGGFDALGAQLSEGVVSGILGDRFRLKAIVTGTYANTTLACRILAS